MAKKKIIQSAAFKRNTLTVAAVLLFGLIVISEMVLAVSIPWYLQSENAMAKEVQRLNLRDSYDAARDRAHPSGVRDEIKQAELRLIRWSLDGMANYLRRNNTRMDSEQMASVQRIIDTMFQIATKIKTGTVYSREHQLDTAIYLQSLIPAENQNGKK